MFGSQGPLPIDWAKKLALSRGLWGVELRREMTRYNHASGFKMVGEVEPRPENRVELTGETDARSVPIPRVVFSYSDNDRRLIRHATSFMQQTLEAAGGREVWVEHDTAHLMGGCRMGDDPGASVTDGFGRTWDVSNLWICDGSLFPASAESIRR